MLVPTGHTEVPSAAQLAARIPAAVAFFTPRSGLLALHGGGVLGTRDGGRTWVRVRFRGFSSADAVSARVAFAVRGRTLLRTRDGGRSWRRVGMLPFSGAVDFADAAHGWLQAGARARATADGGRTWRRLRTPCGRDDVTALALADRAHGFALCGGQPATIEQEKRLYATGDGGRTWRLRATSRSFAGPRARGVIPSQGHVGGLVFRNAREGVAIVGRVGLYATTDGGLHWRTALFTDDGPFVAAVAWPSARARYALLADGELAREDGTRRRWRLVYPHTLPQPDVFAFSDAAHGVGAGRSGLRYDPGAVVATADGGRSWHARGHIRGADGISQLVAVSPDEVYAVALSGRRNRQMLVRSRDAARSWRRVPTPRGAHFFVVAFTSPEHGVLGDERRRLYATDNGGRSWRLVSRVLGQTPIAFATPRLGFAVLDGGVYRTADGGVRWNRLAMRERALAVSALGPSHAWVVAARPCAAPRPNCAGTIVRTRDGGRTWERIRLNMVPAASELDFVTPAVGYAKDPWTMLYRTRDGGRTWRVVWPRTT